MTEMNPRDVRVIIGANAARAEKVFEETLTTSTGPLPPETARLNLLAHHAAFYGWSVVALLQHIGEAYGAEAAAEAAALVDDIGHNGDDGRADDIWPDVEARLAEAEAASHG